MLALRIAQEVRHYAPWSLRRVVALEPGGTVVETAGASSFRLALGRNGPGRTP
jgi:hypothetical protein